MKTPVRFRSSTQILPAFLLCVNFLIAHTRSFSQSPSGSARKAIDSLLSPATGNDALKSSCKRISAALSEYVQAYKTSAWDKGAIPSSLDDMPKLESRIKQLDGAETIELFIRHTIEYLIRYPESSSFAQRLWKLSAITELTERKNKSNILRKPLFPALLNACSMLPPDNPFNLEAKFLEARHYRHLGLHRNEESLFRDLLQRPRLSREARYTINKLLGDFLESRSRFSDAIDVYIKSSSELEGLPQSIDMKLRASLLHLENGNRNDALIHIRALASTPPELLKLTAAPALAETLIRLSGNDEALKSYWDRSDRWWKKWTTLRKELGHSRPNDEKRLPDLLEISGIEKKIAATVASNNDEEFHNLLDLLMHALRWCPSVINQAGPSLCFFATRVNPDHQRQICEFTINLCKDFTPKGSASWRSSILYQTICYSDTDQNDAAVALIQTFRASDSLNVALSETITRLWAHLAIAGHTETRGPRKALEETLQGPVPAFNRPQSVLYLARLYRLLKLEEEEKLLLKRELTHADVQNDKAGSALLTSRYNELTQDKAANSELASAATQWSNHHAPSWLEFTLPEGLNDPRLKATTLSNALVNPTTAKISSDEAVKLQILVAKDEDTEFNLRIRAFYAAFATLYSGSPTHSASRKMLRDILRDDRFPEQLQQVVLAYSLEEALSRHRKRDITSAITHPVFTKSNDRMKLTREAYLRFSNTDLVSRQELEDCVVALTSESVTQSSLTVITAVFECLLGIGEREAAQKIANGMASWKIDQTLLAGRDALQTAFKSSVTRAGGTIPFSREMSHTLRKNLNGQDPDEITNPSDYRKEIDLKRLPEKQAYALLLRRATAEHTLENAPGFWTDLAELMPRNEEQVEFSFLLVKLLLTSNISDLEKSYAIFSTPSIIDTDNPALLKRLLELFERHRDASGEPNSNAAMRIVETQSRDLRQGIPINLDLAWKDLEHPALNRILTSNKLSQLMAHREQDELRKLLKEIPEEELFSNSLIDISWPALIMADMQGKAEQAEDIVIGLIPSLVASGARNLDFHSIRLVYAAAKRLKSPDIIPNGWLGYLDQQIKSERDRYSLRIIDAEFREDWKSLLEWSTKAVTEYPTYYNYYRPHGIALTKLGRKAEAIRSLEIYTKYSHDEIHWHDATQLLEKIRN